MNLTMKLDMGKMRELAEKNLITIRPHPTEDLLIFNYTPECQHTKSWDEYTLACRGIITDLEGNILSRPFGKFFNIEEYEYEGSKLPPLNWKQPFVAMKKMDGYLGILYTVNGKNFISTRGSFTSEMAHRANEIMKKKGYESKWFNPRMTYLFEIIYPEGRIVVDYGVMEDLVLLDIIETSTGESVHPAFIAEEARRIGCPKVEFFSATGSDLQDELRLYMKKKEENEEGLVIRFLDGTRVKMKFEEYKRLHYILTGVSTLRIWEALMFGKGLSEMLDRVPDEFADWVKETAQNIQGLHDDIERKAYELANLVKWESKDMDQRSALRYMHGQIMERSEGDHRIAKIASSMARGKYENKAFIREWLWRQIRPEHSNPFRQDTDA